MEDRIPSLAVPAEPASPTQGAAPVAAAPPPASDEPPPGSFWAKFWVAMAFSTITDKVGFAIGALMDLNHLVGTELSLFDKIKTSLSFTKVKNKILEYGGEELKEASKFKWQSLEHFAKWFAESTRTFVKAGKYTLLGGLITAVIGGVVGWLRGERIEKSSDLLHHPIRSTRIILGLESPDVPAAVTAPPPADQAKEFLPPAHQHAADTWQNRVKSREHRLHAADAAYKHNGI